MLLLVIIFKIDNIIYIYSNHNLKTHISRSPTWILKRHIHMCFLFGPLIWWLFGIIIIKLVRLLGSITFVFQISNGHHLRHLLTFPHVLGTSDFSFCYLMWFIYLLNEKIIIFLFITSGKWDRETEISFFFSKLIANISLNLSN